MLFSGKAKRAPEGEKIVPNIVSDRTPGTIPKYTAANRAEWVYPNENPGYNNDDIEEQRLANATGGADDEDFDYSYYTKGNDNKNVSIGNISFDANGKLNSEGIEGKLETELSAVKAEVKSNKIGNEIINIQFGGNVRLLTAGGDVGSGLGTEVNALEVGAEASVLRIEINTKVEVLTRDITLKGHGSFITAQWGRGIAVDPQKMRYKVSNKQGLGWLGGGIEAEIK